jgi:hypothetical protein
LPAQQVESGRGERLRRKHRLEEYAPVAGLKGSLITLINNAIDALS